MLSINRLFTLKSTSLPTIFVYIFTTIFTPISQIISLQVFANENVLEIANTTLLSIYQSGDFIQVQTELKNNSTHTFLATDATLEVKLQNSNSTVLSTIEKNLTEDFLPSETQSFDLDFGVLNERGAYSIVYKLSGEDTEFETIHNFVVLGADTTAPSGSFEISSSFGIDRPVFNINLNINNVAGSFENISDIAQVEYSFDNFLSATVVSTDELQVSIPFEYSSDEISANSFYNLYTIFAKITDGSGNTSDVISSDFQFVPSSPSVSVELVGDHFQVNESGNQIFREFVEFNLIASSNINIERYYISNTEVDPNGISWNDFETQATSQNIYINHDLTSVLNGTGNYSVFVYVKNSAGQVTSQQLDLYYRVYDISPELNLSANKLYKNRTSEDKLLIGAENVFSATVKNTGADIGYNTGVEIILPAGSEYIESLEFKEYENKLSAGGMEPTKISTLEDGRLKLEFRSIDDLLTDEETTVHFRAKVPGVAQGYKLDDIFNIQASASLAPRVDFSAKVVETVSQEFVLVPFLLDYETAGSSLGSNEVLVETDVNNQITVTTNPDIAASTLAAIALNDWIDIVPVAPLVITVGLLNGMSYVQNSSVVKIDGVVTDLFTVVESFLVENPTVSWIFEGLSQGAVVTIDFLTKVNKAYETWPVRDFVQHNDIFDISVTADGVFQNPCADEQDCEEPKIYTEETNTTVTAKYFTINKWAENLTSSGFEATKPGDTIRYHIEIKTSPEYDMTGIVITDELPDGISFDINNFNLSFSQDLLLVLQNLENLDGTKTLTWEIQAAAGVQAGSTYSFSYDATVASSYENKDLEGDNRIFARDYLSSKIQARGIWVDADQSYTRAEPLSERLISDSDWASKRVQQVQFWEGIRHYGDEAWSRDIEVKIGDIVEVRAEVLFPSSVPTKNFNFRTFLPAGTKLVSDSFSASSIPSSLIYSWDQISGTIDNGYKFEFEKVEPGSSFELTYLLQVVDEPTLKEAVAIRNLFRADYTNIDGHRFLFRESVGLQIIEPIIELSKSQISGYFARGEEAELRLKIENTGSDYAYRIFITDIVPTRTSLVNFPDEVTTNLGISYPVVYDEGRFVIEDITLAPGEYFEFVYTVLSDSDIIFGDELISSVIISNFANRSLDDEKLAREYPSQTLDVTWYAKEPLLVTSIQRQGGSASGENIGLLRNESGNFVFEIKAVGGSPVYEPSVKILLPEKVLSIVDLASISFSQAPSSNSIVDGVIELEFDEVNGNIQVLLPFQIPVLHAYEDLGEVSIEVVAKDKLGEVIRTDGSEQNSSDVDADDQSIVRVLVERGVAANPSVDFEFFVNDEVIRFTSQQELNKILYSFESSKNIVGFRVGKLVGEEVNWYTLNNYGNLTSVEKSLLDISEDFNRIVTESEIENLCDNMCEPLVEGQNKFLLQLVDLDGYVYEFEDFVVKDTTAPVFAIMKISPFADDLSDRTYTALRHNYINFLAADIFFDAEGNPVFDPEFASGLGEFRYSIGGDNWSEWALMVDGINSILVEFPEIESGEKYTAYLQVKDLAGNLYVSSQELDFVEDDIIFTTDIPFVVLNLNDGAEYTKSEHVTTGIEIMSHLPIGEIRFGSSTSDVLSEMWFGYSYENTTHRALDISKGDGLKTLCVQVRDIAGALSEVNCDEILLDQKSPFALIAINNGEADTQNIEVTLNILATDPDLDDGRIGSWAIEMQFSQTGRDCELISDETEYQECLFEWSDWETYSSTKTWQIPDTPGSHRIYSRLRDAVGNVSQVFTNSIVFNPYKGTGNIIINNNDVFTNSRYVNLDLSVNMSELNCPSCTRPVLMKVWQGPTPAAAASQWMEYTSSMQWDIDAGNLSYPNYGVKTVFVQYKLPNTTETPIYQDSIIYAPFYGVEYFVPGDINRLTNTQSTAEFESGGNYTIANLPRVVVSQEEFKVNFDVKNTGSFTWPSQQLTSANSNPVYITYRWVRIGGAIPEGWSEDLIPTIINGDLVVLPRDVAYEGKLFNLEMSVNTPLLPGEYRLEIDTQHQSTAWFGDFGSYVPTYSVRVLENTDKPLPTPEFGSVIGENVGAPLPIPYDRDTWDGNRDGFAPNCEDTANQNNYSGRRCVIGGKWLVTDNTQYQAVCAPINGGHYEYMIATNMGKYYFCPGNTAYYNTFLNTDVVMDVTWFTNRTGFNINAHYPQRKTWDGRYNAAQNNPKLSQTIVVNRGTASSHYEFEVTSRLFNAGTAIWDIDSKVYLVALNKPLEQGGTEVASPFANSSWHSATRIKPLTSHSGWGGGSLVPFTYKFRIPEAMPYGKYTQCFVLTNDPYIPWERRDSFCYTFDVQMSQKERRNFVCSQPQPVYSKILAPKTTGSTPVYLTPGPDELPFLIGYVQQNTEFVVKGKQDGWSLVYFPTGEHQEGWVEDNLDCFSAAEYIDNIIPAPVFETIQPIPEGSNQGVVIRLDGINVYKGPDERFPVVTNVSYNDKVTVLAETYLNDGKYGGWLYIRLDDKSKCKTEDLTKDKNSSEMFCEGWVPKGTIYHVNDPEDVKISLIPEKVHVHACGGDIAVYAAAGVKVQIGTIKKGANFGINMKWNNWYEVFYDNGKVGWIELIDGVCDGFVYPREVPVCRGESLAYPYSRTWTLTSKFGPRWGGFHNGIDIGAAYGTPVLASADGVVTIVSSNGGCSTNPHGGGKYVDIRHANGLTTRYLHLSGFANEIRVGANVFQGMIIGYTGNTGCVVPWPSSKSSTSGTHLHFEVFETGSGRRLDPESVLSSGVSGCVVDDSINQEAKKERVSELIKKQEEEWDTNGTFITMPDWRGDLHFWNASCKVWIKDYKYVNSGAMRADEANTHGHSGGALLYNPSADKVILVANGIWIEYIEEGGPCGKLGLPKLTNGKTYEQLAGISSISRNKGVTSAYYQRFEKGSIYWHWNSAQNKGYTHAVYGEISNIYEKAGGTWSSYGFPISDRIGNCQQFEFGNICENARERIEKTDLEKFIDIIKQLEKHYDDTTIVGIIFRFLEPETWWNYAAPDTSKYQYMVLNNAIPECKKGAICKEQVKQILNSLADLVNCTKDKGCENTTGKRLSGVIKSRNIVNTGHVFAGLSEYYFPNMDSILKNYIKYSLAGFPNVNMRSYIGDYGAVLSNSLTYPNFENLDGERRIKIIEEQLNLGVFSKGDLYADVDSYQIIRLIKQGRSLSQALEYYFLAENTYYNNRFSDFGENTLSIRWDLKNNKYYPDHNKFAEVGIQIVDFAFLFRTWPLIQQCGNSLKNGDFSGLDECTGNMTKNKMEHSRFEYYGPEFTQATLYNHIACFAMQEQGVEKCILSDIPIN